MIMQQRLQSDGLCWCVPLLLIASATALGHEGHQPLPTIGHGAVQLRFHEHRSP